MPLTALILEERLMKDVSPGNPDRFLEMLSQADEYLLRAGKWMWTRASLELVPANDCITLPAGYESIVGSRLDNQARDIRWQEIEYLEDGPGLIPVQNHGGGQLVDEGMKPPFGSTDPEDEPVRTYKVTDSSIQLVTVLARYAPLGLLTADSTPRCQSFIALKRMLFSLLFEAQGDITRGPGYAKLAVDALNDMEKSQRGTAKQIYKTNFFGPLPMRHRLNLR